ncbi:uncharacterized protein LAESUDRAFT_728003 [Laetiporus sulphureus 93-53]|uniref:Uncharacterized protein n=1 Tax=Laetiporus sulphureus 93-53 TaxID=1314785 RepID=A0A165DBY4_9APHY|nr:uncharacterized protein LAESUDRAFT_728003 [Laetiporus sulphureus 93-53]KZT04521.1 hypothetical protein LAESUDRAFT_728003 [Laetiporus sulphureus 93-53]
MNSRHHILGQKYNKAAQHHRLDRPDHIFKFDAAANHLKRPEGSLTVGKLKK